MGRELSMVRRLEKIEKEFGYCLIKLEKEQRLQTQLQFLSLQRSGVVETLARYDPTERTGGLHGDVGPGSGRELDSHVGRTLEGVDLLEVHRLVAVQPGGARARKYCQAFSVVGVVPLLRAELEIIDRELEDLRERLATFEVFRRKKARLKEEREAALATFRLDADEPIHEISREFEVIEARWNALTEDLMNIETAVSHLEHASDYLGSARSFVLAARGQFNIERWLAEGYLLDLFKHSSVGRAREMVEGAERNLKMALRELACLDQLPVDKSHFAPPLVPFLRMLFQDIFVEVSLDKSLEFLQRRLLDLERLQADLGAHRDAVLQQQERQEKRRVDLFAQIGDERRRLSAVN